MQSLTEVRLVWRVWTWVSRAGPKAGSLTEKPDESEAVWWY